MKQVEIVQNENDFQINIEGKPVRAIVEIEHRIYQEQVLKFKTKDDCVNWLRSRNLLNN